MSGSSLRDERDPLVDVREVRRVVRCRRRRRKGDAFVAPVETKSHELEVQSIDFTPVTNIKRSASD
jgi:hypothetical protein